MIGDVDAGVVLTFGLCVCYMDSSQFGFTARCSVSLRVAYSFRAPFLVDQIGFLGIDLVLRGSLVSGRIRAAWRSHVFQYRASGVDAITDVQLAYDLRSTSVVASGVALKPFRRLLKNTGFAIVSSCCAFTDSLFASVPTVHW